MENKKTLRQLIDDRFSIDELKEMCFDIDIDWEHIPYVERGKPIAILNLLLVCISHGKKATLLSACKRVRPNDPWDELANQPTDSYLRVSPIASAAFSLPPQTPSELVGCQTELAQLKKYLQVRNHLGCSRFACVCGLPGQGKTALVAQALNDTLGTKEDAFELMLWLDVNDAGLTHQLIFDILSQHSKSHNLLILDGLSQNLLHDLRAYLSRYSPQPGSKLILVCDVSFIQSEVDYLVVKRLDEPSAAELFLSHWQKVPNDSERRAIEFIVGPNLLGGHPSAICTIADYAKAGNTNLWQLWLECKDFLSTESNDMNFVTPVREQILRVYASLDKNNKHLLQWLLRVKMPFSDDMLFELAEAIGLQKEISLMARESLTQRFMLLKSDSDTYSIPAIIQQVLDKASVSEDSELATKIISAWKSKSKNDQLRQESLAALFEVGEYGRIITQHQARFSNVFVGLDVPRENLEPLSAPFAAYALANWHWQQKRDDMCAEWAYVGIAALDKISAIPQNAIRLKLRLHITVAASKPGSDSINYLASIFDSKESQTQFPYEYAKWLLLQGIDKRNAGDSEAALDFLIIAEIIFSQLQSDRVQLIKAKSNMSTPLTDLGRFAESNTKNEEALNIARSLDTTLEVRQLQLDCLNNLLDNETKLGNFKEAVQYADAGQRLLQDRYESVLLNNRLILLVTHALMTFDFKDADGCLALQREAKVVSRLSGINNYNGYLDILDLWIQFVTGDKISTQYRLSELEDQYLSDTIGDPDTAMLYSLVQSQVDFELDSRNAAYALLDRAAQSFRESDRPYHAARMNLAYAELLSGQTDSQHKMQELLNEAQTIFETVGATYYSDKTKSLLADK